ncbi:hypothetical protein ACP70R_010543 [Stipagrostis hirtigluma subsp. patula]
MSVRAMAAKNKSLQAKALTPRDASGAAATGSSPVRASEGGVLMAKAVNRVPRRRNTVGEIDGSMARSEDVATTEGRFSVLAGLEEAEAEVEAAASLVASAAGGGRPE